jgi:hypothetical protein
MKMRIAALSMCLLLTALRGFSESEQSLTGTISDTMCGAKHMTTNVSPAQCVRECVKSGSDYGLISGGKVYILKGDMKQIDKYAGQMVKVTGDVSGSMVKVRSFTPAS